MKIRGYVSILARVALIAAVIGSIAAGGSKKLPKATAAPSATPSVRTVTISAAGDCTFGTDENADVQLPIASVTKS